MSFSFSINDFLAVGKLTIRLWRSFKDAPAEFAEITRELASISNMITDLSDQAGSQTSLLNRRGASRKQELLALCDNLNGTLEELEDIHRKYQLMGRNAWVRVQLGERDLTPLRTRLGLHLNLLNGFVNSLTMAAVGRMEPMMVEILRILHNSAKGHGLGARSLLDAQSSSGRDEQWGRVEIELQSEGIPLDYVQEHIDDIRTLLDEVIEVEGLSVFDDIRPGDSASQVAGPAMSTDHSSGGVQSSLSNDPDPTARLPQLSLTRGSDTILGGASREEIKAATISIMNYGYKPEKLSPLDIPVQEVKVKSPFIKLRDTVVGTTTTRTKRAAQTLAEHREYQAGALCAAAIRGNLLAVRLILQKGVNVNALSNRETAINKVIRSNCTDAETTAMIELLVQFGGDVHYWRRQGPNLFSAVSHGKVKVAECLLNQGVNVDEMAADRTTALFKAAANSNKQLVDLLLKRGALAGADQIADQILKVTRDTPATSPQG
ncbi:hypothetical protein L207DRAFT_571955 [Hyaloscypha variabilis F]|uniref:Uncharacterized protein n=1 Tax=Hyaloscypha variabilis (strain UAMH 11265 / GT02V1 / F) TaxID=1149755 RepID=A0A2J6R2E1_HYAVF|nr:hypothetical protein L207DRAFT_571955 [Hyaloscypha variabilis F]